LIVVKKSWRPCAIFGLFLLAGLIAFSNIINSWFLSDDFAQIGKVLAGDLSVVWGREHGGFFRPLFILSYLIDGKLWGARPLGFHLTNVVFHSLNAFLTSILSLRLVDHLKLSDHTKRMVSIGAGALFLLHPSHTEAVSWISGRADVLATFFCLASLLSYLEYARSRRFAQLALSFLCFALGLLAKESAICLPFLVLTVGLFTGAAFTDRKAFRRFLAAMAIYFSILVVFVAIRSFFIGSLVGGYGASQHLNFSPKWLRDRLLEASVRSVLPVLPSQLSWYLFKPLQSRVFILFSLACAGAVAVAILLRRRWYRPSDLREQNRFLIGLVILFLFSLLPVINLRLTLYQTLGERFVYLPSVFSCLFMAYLAAILIRNRRLLFSILICVLGFYSVRLYQTNRSWSAAARLSRSATNELVDSSTGDHLIILNAPDNLRGVPVFHNGLPEALLYFQNRKRFRQVEIIAFQDLQSPLDEVALSWRTGSLGVHLTNENDSFIRFEPSGCFETMAQPNNLRLLAKPCAANADLFFFNKGRMLKVPDR
jgi:protein O-mannosyl-transferase